MDDKEIQTPLIELPDYAANVLKKLEEAGYEAWLVGGCVRDALMGIEPHDFDIAASARPEQIEELFDHTAGNGMKHGTVIVIEGGQPVEVTTFRKEDGVLDHRHPENLEFVDTLQEDLSRRDFTINAMAWHPQRGLKDPFGGQKDLEKRLIRAVGDAELRFEEDALRMLRAYRFAAKLGFDLEEKTEQAIRKKEHLSACLAPERVVPEVEQVMEYDPQKLEKMTGLLRPWIPELEQMLACEQNSPFHYTDVLHHTIDALKHVKPFDKTVAWALLLHDTGKIKAKTTDEKGQDHFKKHELYSEKIAKRVVRDLRLSSSLQKQVPLLVKMHDVFYAPRPGNLYKLRVLRGLSDEMAEKLFMVQYADIMAHTSHDRLSSWQAFVDYYRKNREQGVPMEVSDLPVDGNDIAAYDGVKGKMIHQVQLLLLQRLMEKPNLNNRENVLQLLPELGRQAMEHSEQEKNNKNRSSRNRGSQRK